MNRRTPPARGGHPCPCCSGETLHGSPGECHEATSYSNSSWLLTPAAHSSRGRHLGKLTRIGFGWRDRSPGERPGNDGIQLPAQRSRAMVSRVRADDERPAQLPRDLDKYVGGVFLPVFRLTLVGNDGTVFIFFSSETTATLTQAWRIQPNPISQFGIGEPPTGLLGSGCSSTTRDNDDVGRSAQSSSCSPSSATAPELL
jgi:hypothetical protein